MPANARLGIPTKGDAVSDSSTPDSPSEPAVPEGRPFASPVGYPPASENPLPAAYPPAAPVYAAPGTAVDPAPAYGPAPDYGVAASSPPRTNPLAIVSLVASISAFVLLPLLGSIVGVITGHIALSQVKRTGESGRGLALTGVILGWVGLGLILLGVILLAIFLPVFLANLSLLRLSS